MRSLHFLVKMVVTAVLIATCVFVFMYPVSELWRILTGNLPDNDLYRQILAGVAGAGIFLAFLPLWPRRGPKVRTFSFQGTHGEVTVELEPVEATLERVLNKLPEVKWVTVKILPEAGTPSKIVVDLKGSFRREDASDIRHTSTWIQSFVKTRTQKMLGVQNVEVKLYLKSQSTNMRSVKPEPLLLEGPAAGGLAASSYAAQNEAGPAPDMSAHAPQPQAALQPEFSPQPESAPQPQAAPEPHGDSSRIPDELRSSGSASAESRYQSPAFQAADDVDIDSDSDEADGNGASIQQGPEESYQDERRRPETW